MSNMSKRMKVIFTFSLLFNLILFGLVGGHLYHRSQEVRPWAAWKGRLTPETHALMKETFHKSRADIKGIFTEVKEKKTVLEAVYGAEVFDPQAYDAAAADLQQLGMKISKHKLDTFKGLAGQLPQSERQILAQKLSKIVLGRHGKRHGKYREMREEKTSKSTN